MSPAATIANRVAYESPYASPNHLRSIVAPDWMPAEAMDRAAALAIPAVSRARLIITSTVARVPLVAYRGTNRLDGSERPRWLDRTDGPMSPYHRMLSTVDDLLFYGWSAWAVERDAMGQVIAADHIPFHEWEITAEGAIKWNDAAAGVWIEVDPSTVILIPGSHAGILAEAPVALKHARDLLTAATTAASTPSAYVELHQTNDVPMTDAEIDKLIDRWTAARRGDNGGVAFTSAGIETKEMGAYNEHLLVEGRNAAAVDVARALGVPSSVLDATTPTASLNYETREGRASELVDYCLAAYMAPIAARLGMDDMSPRGNSVEFDIGAVFGTSSVAVPDDDNTKVVDSPQTADRKTPDSAPAGGWPGL